jgi:hypothetical protein
MTHTTLASAQPRIHYSVQESRGTAQAARTVVLCNALGCDLTMCDALAERLS